MSALSHDGLSTAEWMVLSVIADRIEEYGLHDALPDVVEIDRAIDSSYKCTSIHAMIGAAWEDAAEIVYDKFPKFRDPEDEEEDVL